MWRRRRYTLQHQTCFSRQGLSSSHKRENRSKWLSGTALIMSAWEAGRCSLACYSSLSCPGEPSDPLTPSALFVTRMPGRETGSWGQGLYALSTEKGHHRGLVGPLRDDREVRGPQGSGGVEPVESLLKTLVGMLPHSKKGPGVPICQLVLPGCSSFRG